MRSLINSLKTKFIAANMHSGDFIASLFASFVAASIVFALSGPFDDLTYERTYSVPVFIACIVVAFIVMMAAVLLFKTRNVVHILFYCLSIMLCVVFVADNPEDIYFNIGLAFVLVLIIRYCAPFDSDTLNKKDISKQLSFILTLVLFISYVIFIYIVTAARYKAFYDATYDFGIFAQMFEQMAKTGLPMTSVERGETLSHFAVHFSPIFYLYLPGYYIFRTPLYLLFVQALVTGLGAFPIRRICKSLGFSNRICLLFAAIYLLYPTISVGTFFDFHENKILSVLILYTIWFVLENKRIGVIVFSLLTLCVKEDAFIYVFTIAVWMFLTKRDRILAIIIAAASVGYFVFACQMINLCGGEIMSNRYDNYSADSDKSLISVIKTCFVDIGYVIKEVFSGADIERFKEFTYSGQKMEFVLWTCIPLAMLPFLQKKLLNLVLLVPMLVINLMPYWLYQSSIHYQYTYGSVALLIFAAILALTNIPERFHNFILMSMLAITIVFTTSVVCPKAARYLTDYGIHKSEYDETEKTLQETFSEMDEDISVTAYGYMMPHLWYIDDLDTCPEYYKELRKTDYYVIDTRYENDDHTRRMYDAMDEDYSIIATGGYVKIYKLNNLIEE